MKIWRPFTMNHEHGHNININININTIININIRSNTKWSLKKSYLLLMQVVATWSLQTCAVMKISTWTGQYISPQHLKQHKVNINNSETKILMTIQRILQTWRCLDHISQSFQSHGNMFESLMLCSRVGCLSRWRLQLEQRVEILNNENNTILLFCACGLGEGGLVS
jgi:hypothetical protein